MVNYLKNYQKKIEILKEKTLSPIFNPFMERDSDKVGFLVSSLFHLSIIITAIGIPSCFQPTSINVPNIIPIEILQVDDVTRIPSENKIEKELDESKKTSKQERFSSSEQSEIIKIQPQKEKIIEVEEKIENKVEILPKNEEEIPLKQIENIEKDEALKEELKFESLPSKKIKPKIKPQPSFNEKKESDIIVTIKPKPKPDFSISSVLKDLRKNDLELNPQDDSEEKEMDNSEVNENQSSNQFTINEIDLLKQQLYGCWSVPAGAKGAKDMIVKVRVWVNPDRTVNNALILDTNRMQSDPFFRSVAESALRAVLDPACNPLKLPPEKYEVWKKFIFKFELGWMLGN